MVPHCSGVLVIDDPLSLITFGVWLMAAGMYPLGFLFGACSPCCEPCPWELRFDRCLRIAMVGTSPAVGGDARVSLDSLATLGGMEGRGPGLGPIEVYRVATQITATVRITLSASGASRTPVGETRTQVWQFIRPTPVSPPATAYDVLGPSWHLQVDLSVTGVATQEESGVSSSLGVDINGQTKLILQVNQWTDAITHDAVVMLTPVGLQRWGSFRLSQTSTSATLQSGVAQTGWSVSVLSDVTTTQHSLAVRILGVAISTAGTLTERVLLDSSTAIGFLNGEGSIQIPATAGTTSLSILQDNLICGVNASHMEVGIPLGVYPEFCTLSVPESFRQSPIGTRSCVPAEVAMRPFGQCIQSWLPTFNRRGVGISSPTASHASFYAGTTLLWNLENGPYRQSFTTTGPNNTEGWIVTLGGTGDYSFYDLNARKTCPEGFANPFDDVCVPPIALVHSWEGQAQVIDQAFSSAQECFSVEAENVSYTTKVTSFSGNNVDFWPVTAAVVGNELKWRYNQPSSGLFIASASDGDHTRSVVTAGGKTCGNVSVQHNRRWLGIYYRVDGGTITCDPSGDLPYSVSLNSAEEVLNAGFPGTSGVPPQLFIPTGVVNILPGNPRLAPLEFSYSVAVVPSPYYVEAARDKCSNWTPSAVAAGGATVNRTCTSDLSFLGITQSRTFGTSRLRVPRLVAESQPYYVGTSNITRAATCMLLNPRRLNPASTGSVTIAALSQGDCVYLVPQSGSGFSSPGTGDSQFCNAGSVTFTNAVASPRDLSCGGCTPTVEITAGQANATVRYVTGGDKAGLIEVIALRTWGVNEGVTFLLSCGGQSVTHTVRR